MTISNSQRTMIAEDLQALYNDSDVPVSIDGFIWNGETHDEMPGGEAARIVVDTVLDSDFVKGRLEEAEAYWEGLKWLSLVLAGMDARERPVPPAHLRALVLNAVAAGVDEYDNRGVV